MTGLLWIHLERTAVPGAGPADHHVIDRAGKRVEEPGERVRIARVERGAAQRAEFMCRCVQALRITRGKDDVSALGSGVSSCLEPDARATAYHNDCLSGQFLCPPLGDPDGGDGHAFSDRWPRVRGQAGVTTMCLTTAI